jgi:hypothetical protein
MCKILIGTKKKYVTYDAWKSGIEKTVGLILKYK